MSLLMARPIRRKKIKSTGGVDPMISLAEGHTKHQMKFFIASNKSK